ncbi:glycosyltransferase family 2 protein [[Limnothrix rosea] IAM M-220]|uniref:glycosyltransferase family 2 protein n=1 Tax=[Limnothrix rosea] IAM M-220 TaxID=454133 RepID=UPI0009644A15|nr:glycosyltransferase family 2 protein [[Limnothrix rosea] IAM M-220]OKH11497.1 family 2 glycosyl transferase [[Limnothrix rosea] IAM M-220]
MDIKVSILIPCYNAKKWIAASIESALNQTYLNKEIIVVDDGSTDGSLEIVKSFGDKIIWETQPNQGGNITRNNLLKLSTGEWVQYLDADDYLKSEKIANQMAIVDKNPSLDIVCSPALTEYHRNGTIEYESSAGLTPKDPWILLAKWALPQTGGSLWRKQAIADVGGWNEALTCCQEHELYSRLLIGGKQFGYLDKSEAIYRIWSEKTVSRKNPLLPLKNRLKVQDNIEAHLLSIKQMTPERQRAISQARFDCARVLYPQDQKLAVKLIKKIKKQDSDFVPSGNTSPESYKFLFKTFGFKVAQGNRIKKRGQNMPESARIFSKKLLSKPA